MQVVNVLIGQGEVYVSRYRHPREFVEVVHVRRLRGGSMHIEIATNLGPVAMQHSERIVFGARAFLAQYRPATAADCRAARSALNPKSCRNSALSPHFSPSAPC